MNLRLNLVRGAILSLAIVLLAGPAWGDIPPGPSPRPRPRPTPAPAPIKAPDAVPMTIRVDPQAKESVLKIPKKLLPAGKVGMDEPPSGLSPTRSAIAALAMSAGIIGAFFVRRNRKARALIVGIIGVAALTAAGTLLADVRPPLHRPTADDTSNGTPLTFQLPAAVDGKVVIQITNGGDAVTLTLAGNGAAAAPVPDAAPAAPAAPSP